MTIDQIFAQRVLPKFKARVERSIKLNFQEEGRPAKWQKSLRAALTGGRTLSDKGILRNSINVMIENQSRIVASSPVKYAAIHNFGGTIPAREIKPKNAKALSWVSGGNRIYSKGHTIPATKIPKREFMMLQTSDVEYFSKIIEKEIPNAFI